MKVSVTGASGFIGNRLVEIFHLRNLHEVIPLVRTPVSLVLPARFNIPWTVCDHFDADALSRSFAGSDIVVHAAFGTPLGKMSRAVYEAADKAGVRRVVVLSSASIYNQNPLPGTTEESPLPRNPVTAYNANKIAADQIVRRARAKGRTEVVFLLPGVVYGPRSQWIARLAEQVSQGTTYLINGGTGICNAVYVDNLIAAVNLAATASGVDLESFFISDAETITWKDFYGPALAAFGKSLTDVHNIEPGVFSKSVTERVREQILDLAESKTVQRVKPHVPPIVKRGYKLIVSNPGTSTNPIDMWTPVRNNVPNVALDMNYLQQATYKLPNTKASRMLNYKPEVTFDEGMARSIKWLNFAGYGTLSSLNK
jgi:nucleoside-diphosphate-sugar epimerase